ncbi:MAG: metalloregulator ArsR/SmtB family transcription factor [Candidatus Melainabacteria bacterium]|nr:metalloregulator ArsR/SmtB family transcription factor [Candidatus Melainabacteria bacterium]
MNDRQSQLRQFKAEFFKALSSPIRIAILDELRHGERSSIELKENLKVESAYLSQQLAILRTKNIVVSQKRGSSTFYKCTDPSIYFLLDAAKLVFQSHFIEVKNTLDNISD